MIFTIRIAPVEDKTRDALIYLRFGTPHGGITIDSPVNVEFQVKADSLDDAIEEAVQIVECPTGITYRMWVSLNEPITVEFSKNIVKRS